MTEFLISIPNLLLVLLGAFAAGFTTGFAGFGTGLVSSGFWFHTLPAPMVPPLVVLASVAAHAISLRTVNKTFIWRRARPFIIGGLIGVPFGVWALSVATPNLLRVSIGLFLIVYAALHLSGLARLSIGPWGGRSADGGVGLVGGFLGGFAGLSGALPLIWLQLRGGPTEQQRATYQPFNIVVLAVAGLAMAINGQITLKVLIIAGICLPVTLFGAWLGARAFTRTSEELFKKVVLALLLGSGVVLVIQVGLG